MSAKDVVGQGTLEEKLESGLGLQKEEPTLTPYELSTKVMADRVEMIRESIVLKKRLGWLLPSLLGSIH